MGIARQVRSSRLKLEAVRDMLGDQATELRGRDAWDSDEGSPGLRDDDELPHREEAPPQRIVQVPPPLCLRCSSPLYPVTATVVVRFSVRLGRVGLRGSIGASGPPLSFRSLPAGH